MHLYYGNGNCTVDEGLRILVIHYRGSIKITDKTNDNHAILVKNKRITIFPVGQSLGLSELFDYEGEFKIVRAKGVDMNGDKVYVIIKRVMDYSELIYTNAEDLTVNSEDLNSGHVYGNRITKTTIDKTTINIQLASGNLYLEDGSPYSGAYHIHIDGGRAMTGGTHTKDSVNLQVKKLKDKKWRIPK